MIIALICIGGFLVVLWLVLSTALRLRPRVFRFKATLTKWISVDLEMQQPAQRGGRYSSVEGKRPRSLRARSNGGPG